VATLQLASVKPILAGTSKTNERISNADVLWASRTGGDGNSVRRRWLFSGTISALFSATFLAFAYVSWHPGEGSFNGATSIFTAAAGVVFGFQAAFHFYCAMCKRLPAHARLVEQICNRTVMCGALGFAILGLGYAALLGSGVIQPDFAATRVRYARLAGAGDIEAMSHLAAEFRDGRGGPRDYAKAREWYGKAAEGGDAPAMVWLGWLYQGGLGGAKDLAGARVWFEKAAAKGDGGAMTWLGVNAQFGIGVAKDVTQAKLWYEQAVAAGDSQGMNSLGTLYRDGLGVPQDYGKAREWFEKAAAAGSGPSMNELGALYLNGWSVDRDPGKARAWYEKAVAVGQLDGMQHLAIMVDRGEAGPADPKRAAHLLLSSANLGHPWSKTMLGGPLLFLTPTTRTEIRRELTGLGLYHGSIDGEWNGEARASVTAYLNRNS
jgi:TPR repeat protein